MLDADIMLTRAYGWLGRKFYARFPARVGAAQILKEGAWVFVGQALSMLGLLVGMRLLTGHLPTDVFGTVALLMGISTFGANAFCTPIVQAAWRFYPEAQRDGYLGSFQTEIRKVLFPFAAGLTVFMVALGLVYSGWKDVNPLTPILLAALLPVEVYRNVEVAFLSAGRQQRTLAIWNVAEAWTRPLFAVGFALGFAKTSAAVMAGYLVASGGGLAVWRLVRKPASGDKSGGTLEWVRNFRRSLKQYALPLAPLSIVGWINSFSNRYIIGALLGLGPVGIYSAAYGLTSRPFTAPVSILTTTLRPHFMEAWSNGQAARQGRLFAWWIGSTAVIGLLGVGLISLLKQPIANFLLGEEFRVGAVLFPWLAVGAGFNCLAMVFEAKLYAAKKTSWLLGLHSFLAVVAIVTNVVGAVYFGLMGVAYACAVFYFAHFLSTMILTSRLATPAGTASQSEPIP
jgi:O-antigen/teichoic acid export membrane protein